MALQQPFKVEWIEDAIYRPSSIKRSREVLLTIMLWQLARHCNVYKRWKERTTLSTRERTSFVAQGSQRFLSVKFQTFSRPFPHYLQLFPDPVKSKSLALVTLNPSAHSKLEPSDGADSLTAGGCLAETSDDSAAEDDVALPGCGTTNRAMGDAALSLTFSLCFLPSMWLFTAATPMFETSKSTPHTVQRARSFFPRTGESQDLNRSSESHSVENLHFPISSKASCSDPRNAKKKYCNPLLFRCRFNFGNFGTSIFYLN